MEFLEKLGIDYRLLIAQILNFAILLLVLRRFAYKPIIRVLEKRRQAIAASLANVKALERRVAEGEREREERLRQTQQEASLIVAQARQQGEELHEKILTSAQAEADAVRRAAAAEARQLKEHALDEARAELANLVVTAAGRVLHEKLDEKKDRELAARALEKLTR